MSCKLAPELYPRIFAAMREAVVITDAEANIVFVNPAFERETGYNAEEVKGCNPRILKSKYHDSAFYREMWRALFASGRWEGTVVNRCKDGRLIHVEQRIETICDDGEITHFLSVWRNVTDSVQMQERLLDIEKDQQLGRAVGSIAHDFNNILAAIVGFCEVGLLRVGANPVAKAYFTDIGRTADTGVRLVRKLLSFCRKAKGGSCASLEMESVVASLQPILRNLLGGNVELLVDVKHCTFLVSMSLTDLEQIFLNMAANARDAMEESGGYFSIRCENHTFKSPRASGGQRDFVKLTFTDTGCGIPPEVVKRIFDPFFSTKQREGTGTGLGLHIVQSICRTAGGLIDVESFLGKGTTFHVYLPANRRTNERLELTATQDGALPGGTETVLLVEDDEAQREATAQMLQLLGYRVRTATNGLDVLSYFFSELDEIDLMICDMAMPMISGIELAKRLVEKKPSLRVLFCTGYASQILDLVSNGTVNPALNNVLPKPFTLPQLAGKIRSILTDPALSAAL